MSADFPGVVPPDFTGFTTLELRKAFEQEARERRAAAASMSVHPHVYHHVDFEAEDIYDLPEDAPAEVQEAASKARAVVQDAAEATVFSSLIRGQQIENPGEVDR